MFTTKGGAIGGYDPVAYFTDSKPVKGTAALTYHWQGAGHFAGQQHLDDFRAAPRKYAPSTAATAPTVLRRATKPPPSRTPGR